MHPPPFADQHIAHVHDAPSASLRTSGPAPSQVAWQPTARRRLPVLLLSACLALLGSGCGRGGDPVEVSLAELAARPQAWDGRTVHTRGTVRGFDDPRHYWVEDAGLNRVGIVPAERIAPHLGREVAVVGRFTYARDQGRRITLGSIEAYDPPR